MKTHSVFALAIVCLGCVYAPAKQVSSSDADRISTPSSANETPAQQRVAAARQQIAADPKKVQAYIDLASAYLRRARETDDQKYLGDAEQALEQGLRVDAKDFQLEKTQVELMLAKGQFAEAKQKAAELNRRSPDDVAVYGYLAEAQIGLGEYKDAVTNAQWMMNMLPNNVPALMIGAKLRAHYGDANGAIEFLNLAYTETSPAEVEEQAWIANQIAAIEIDAGKTDAGESGARKINAAIEILNQAERTFPNYPYTTKNLARARAAQNHASDAAPPSAAIHAANDSSGLGIAAPAAAVSSIEATRQQAPAGELAFPPVPEELLTPRASETDYTIRKAQAGAAAHPNDAKAYAALGAAYMQRARETADVADYELAEQALKKSLDLSSTGFGAEAVLETMAEVCMGEHRFQDALAFAERALSLDSGDLSPFAIVGDAYADMGEYDKARDAYERLTPRGAETSLRSEYARDSRLAFLSFIHGETGDAIGLMNAAVAEGTEAAIPSENLAWLYYELGEFEAQAGDAQRADEAYRAALKVNPGNYRALAGMARLRANHGDYGDAILLYQKAIAVVPMPAFVAELGDLYERAGNHAEAKKQYDLVEYIGLLGQVNRVLHNRDLAIFFADHDTKLGEAVELARKEFEVRHDVYTWDALAWALYKDGQLAEAAKASDEATKYGTRDALLHFHAGMIANRLGKADKARSELNAALTINPHFNLLYSRAAQQQLSILSAGTHPQESAANDAR
jgi:tetratricopeptide (TPR) repeat protein